MELKLTVRGPGIMARWVRMAVLAAAVCAGAACALADCRLLLADQSDYNNKRGFYVDLEATAASGAVCQLNTLKMYTGVADGTNWRFPSFVPAAGWQYGHSYQVVVTIGPTRTMMIVDGVVVATSAGGFVPVNENVTVDEVPSWAGSPA